MSKKHSLLEKKIKNQSQKSKSHSLHLTSKHVTSRTLIVE